MIYRVKEQFYDLTDGYREYLPGDIFPREGLTVTAERLAELATSANRLGYPVIVGYEELTEQKPSRKGRKRDAD